MAEDVGRQTGLELLIRECRKSFRIPENMDHYDREDLRAAEKKFMKHCLVSDSPRNPER